MMETAIFESIMGQLGTSGAILMAFYLLTQRLLKQAEDSRQVDRENSSQMVERVTKSFEEVQSADRELSQAHTKMILTAVENTDGNIKGLVDRCTAIHEVVIEMKSHKMHE
tara:strand:+ start:4128 stop:4460 length:333 start_codon:yes stop_codon:yes gene_type:complete